MKSGRSFVALLLGIGAVGALVTGAAIYSRFLYLGILLLVGFWVWTRWVAGSLRVLRSARVQRANVGDFFEEHFEVVNGGRALAPWIEVFNQSSLPYASGSRLLTLMPGHQKRTYLARTWLTRRGAFALGPTRISTGDPFGLFRSSKEIPAAQTLIVLPMLFQIKSFLFPPAFCLAGRSFAENHPTLHRTRRECANIFMAMR